MMSATVICSVATAQDRLAYVIGNGTSEAGHIAEPAEDALAVSRTLLGLGFDVIRREDVSPAALPMGRTAAEIVVLYYSGRTTARDGRTLLMGNRDAGWPLIDTAKAFRRSGASQVVIFVETCHTGASEFAALPGRETWPGVFVAFSADQSGRCTKQDGATFTDRVLAALRTPDKDIHDAFQSASGAGWSVSNLTKPLLFLPSDTDDVVITDADLELLERLEPEDRDRMRSLWIKAGFITAAHAQPVAPRDQLAVRTVENDVISFSSRIEPTDLGTMLTPQVPQNGGQAAIDPVAFTRDGEGSKPAGSRLAGGIRIINAAPQSQVAALPTATGLPRPSVIVGRIQAENASFSPTVSGGTLAGTPVETSGFEARKSIRIDDAKLYVQLVNSGAFDPGSGPRQLETAIQIELDRMGCYTTTIDGIWGGNSAAAVDRYFQQIGETPESREPSVALFRKIVLQDEVRCPETRRATRTAEPATRTTTPRASQPRATQPRATQPRAQPARKKPATGQIQLKPNIFGTGIRG